MKLSPSQISSYRRCSLQWWFSYRAGLKMRPTGKMVQGRAVHKGIEVGLREKAETGTTPPLSLVLDATAQAFDDEAQVAIFDEDEAPDAAKDTSILMTTLHHKEVAPTIEPMLVEHWINVDAGGVALTGIVDCVDVEGRVIDTKTSGKRITEEGIHVDVQLAAYTAGAEAALGAPVVGVRLDRLITTKKPQLQQIEIPRDQVDTQRLGHVARAVAEGIEREVFVPTDNVTVCGWCGFKPVCWGARWWDYLQSPEAARDAAHSVLEHAILPQQHKSVGAGAADVAGFDG